ncbi:MAG: hypothetical protein P4L46_25660 [Fimbriimonas sp.]|nr:hypothetical protein [Fimbriimonas sp.]
MKHVQKFLVAALGVSIVGCGGTGATQKVVSTVLNSTPRIECIVAVQPNNLKHPDAWTQQQLQDPTNMSVKADLYDPTVFGVQDPTNIEATEQMIFQLVYYSTSPSGVTTRNIISSGVSFTTSDRGSVYGVLASNTGQFNASSTASTSPLFVSATYNGMSYASEYDVRHRQARIIGTVLDANTNMPVLAGTNVQFYDSSNTLVDTVTVQFDGSIRASVPTNTKTFTVQGDTLPSGYYRQFSYNAQTFDASVVACFTPIQILSDPTNQILPVATSSLPYNILVEPRVAGEPTPAPTGCTDTGLAVVHHKA